MTISTDAWLSVSHADNDYGFGSVSLFKGISTFIGNLMPNSY